MSSITIDRQDGLSSATAVKGPVRVVAVSNISLTGLQTIDGISLAAGDRVLARGQNTATENGIYVVDTGPWRRATDFAGNRDVKQGTQIYVSQGTTYSASGWYVATANPIVIGTTALTISQNIMLNAAQLIALEASATAAANAAIAAAAAASAALAGLVPSFQTVASAQITVVPALITVGRMLGYYTAGDCPEFLVKRVDAQPSHALKFRGVDRYKADGVTIDLANGGWWEFQLPYAINVRQAGAKGDSNTDDYAALNGCLDYIKAKWGQGALFFPQANGAYLCKSTLFLSTRKFTLYGENRAVTLTSGMEDINLIKVVSPLCTVRELTIYGKGSGLYPADPVFACTQPTLWVSPSAVDTIIDMCNIFGGAIPLLMEGGDSKCYRTAVSLSYGNSLVTVAGGHYFFRGAMDQAWPVQQPSGGYQSLPSTLPVWAAATPYVKGDLVTTGGYVIQCDTAGTSGAVAPTLKPYFVDMPDGAGALVWKLVCLDGMAGYRLGTTAQEVSIIEQDLSLCGANGIYIVAGNTVLRLKITNAIIGQNLREAISINGGKDITIEKIHTGSGFQKDYAVIAFGGSLPSGDTRIANSFLEGGFASVYVTPTTPNTHSVSVQNCYLNPVKGGGTLARAAHVSANVTDFEFIGNRIGTSCEEGIVVMSGTSDHYTISGNINKARLAEDKIVIDNGTGLNKTIWGNN